jgi:hypothetical protein
VAAPQQPTPSALGLALHARDSFRLPPPVPGTAPARATLVNLPTYLFVDPAGWSAHTATAAVPGTTVSVTAIPRWTRWHTGDGASTTCAGPGAPPGQNSATPPGQNSAAPGCGYVYRRTSGPGGFAVSVAVTYEITWTCVGLCDAPGGTLEPLIAEAATRLIVLQARAQLVRS